MMKKALFIILAILPMVMKAQLAVGEWKVYPVFANNVTRMLDTSEKVYYVSEGNLFSYDKNTDESYSYSVVNKLNENEIHNIYYNKDNKYLLIAYKSGNIDLLYDNGKVINMPEIKDAVLSTEKTINDVCFYENRIYVATVFGLVIFDGQKHHVIESGIYNKDIRSVEIISNHIVVSHNWNTYYMSMDNKINTFNKFKLNNDVGFPYDIEVVTDNRIVYLNNAGANGKQLKTAAVDFTREENPIYNSYSLIEECSDTCLFKNKSNNIVILTVNELFIANEKIDENGLNKIELPTELQGKRIAMWEGLNSVWIGDKSGIRNLDISGDNITVLKDNFTPESTSVKKVFFLHKGNSGKIYLSNSGSNDIYQTKGWQRTQINTINNGDVENITPAVFTSNNKNGASYSYKVISDSYKIMEDPDDANVYYVGSFWDGICKVKNNEDIICYNWLNSTITSIAGGYACVAPAFDFDKNNNLWVFSAIDKTTNPALHMLSSAARKKDEVVKTDWVSVNLGDIKGGKDNKILACKKSNMFIISDGVWDTNLVGYDTKGTYENISDDTYMIWSKFIDQDGKNFDPTYICAIVEDHNGKVWIGTDNGVIEITKPTNLIDEKMTINRIKVPRNDGTQLADYLLETLYVTSIAVDGTNKKWLGTLTSGVYLVSENGDEILEHFTTENSSLPSNTIYSLACDPNSNSVFIGTDVGLVEYSSTTAPASTDYSNVYAYPNPVRPEYTGWITIKGLMDNSLVKIADAAGNVFYSTISEGGMVTWDGCNTDGQRVKSGVYYVFASQSEEGNSGTGAVTKILVVN